MEVFELSDIRLTDGMELRYQIKTRLNDYVHQLNQMHRRLSEWDFSREEAYLYFEYRKIFEKKVDALVKVMMLLCSVRLVNVKVFKRVKSELKQMKDSIM